MRIPRATEDSIVKERPVALLDDLHGFLEVDDGHLGDGDDGSEADRDEEADKL